MAAESEHDLPTNITSFFVKGDSVNVVLRQLGSSILSDTHGDMYCDTLRGRVKFDAFGQSLDCHPICRAMKRADGKCLERCILMQPIIAPVKFFKVSGFVDWSAMDSQEFPSVLDYIHHLHHNDDGALRSDEKRFFCYQVLSHHLGFQVRMCRIMIIRRIHLISHSLDLHY